MRRTLSFALIVLAIILSGSLLWAESQARIVRLSLIDGSVELDRATGQGFEKAILNMPITQGMRLRTGSGGNAEVEFESGSTLRLIGNTTVSFGRLSLADDGGKLTAVNLEEGTAYFDIKKKSHDEFAISFAGREIRVTEPSHLRVDVSESGAEVAMFKGEAELAGDSDVHIKKDQTLAFDRSTGDTAADSTAYDISSGVADEPTDAWDKHRSEAISQYARDNAPVTSPYAYGMSDLVQYGSYYNDPGYGWVWRPFGVSYAWEPFANGAWVWYPGFGYTWVSSYPWGWTPYRHGRWVFLPAYGWVWQPGYWNTWWRGPVCVNVPAYYYPPRPPRHRDHRAVWIGTPPAGWTGQHHDRDRGGIHTRMIDRDEGGSRKTAIVGAPGTTPAAKPPVPANGFTGGKDEMIVTSAADRDNLRGTKPPVPRGTIVLRDRDRDGSPKAPAATGSTMVPVPQSATSVPSAQPRVDRGTSPVPTPRVDRGTSPTPTPRVDRGTSPAPTPHVDRRNDTPAPQPRAEAPRPAPVTPRSAPSPRFEPPRPSAPASTPRMDTPRTGGSNSGGSSSSGSHNGGSHSPGGRSPR